MSKHFKHFKTADVNRPTHKSTLIRSVLRSRVFVQQINMVIDRKGNNGQSRI